MLQCRHNRHARAWPITVLAIPAACIALGISAMSLFVKVGAEAEILVTVAAILPPALLAAAFVWQFWLW